MMEEKDFVLNVLEVEQKIKKIFAYLYQQQEKIKDMQNITNIELNKGYKSSINKKINDDINQLNSQLNNINVMHQTNYMEMKSEMLILLEIKNKNLQSISNAETELLK